MANRDLILDSFTTPTYDDIALFFDKTARTLWQDLNTFIQVRYQTIPKIEYSKCSLQKGWNVKYKKAGKSLCTLYPVRDHFITLVVIKAEMIPLIQSLSNQFEPYILDLIKAAAPMNGTLWLMIKVDNKAVLENVKQLLLLKHAPKN